MPATLRLHAAVRSSSDHQVGPHRHGQHELALVLGGDLEVHCGRQLLPGRPGLVHVFPAATEHDQASRGSWRTLCVLFTGDSQVIAAGARVLDSCGDAAVQTWMEQLVALAGSADPDDAASGDALLLALLHRLRRLERDHAAGTTRPPQVVAAMRLIAGRLDRDLDVGHLAVEVGSSRSHLGSLFRAHLGCSPLRWHARLRLERARALLANPYASVGEVARELGFADLNWFVRRFRAAHGLPPGRWRNSLAQRGPGRR